MTLRWSGPTEPAFNPLVDKVHMSAQKDLGDETYVTMSCDFGIGWEGPTPTEEEILGYLGLVYDALDADGWHAQLEFTEKATVTRRIERIEEA
jgi:hypothetical protein